MNDRSSRRGFSLIELMVALALGLGLVAGLLSLLRVQAAVARHQSQAADLQQSLRIARHELARFCRMAGRGGLPDRAAVAVRNNQAAGSRIGGPGTAAVAPDTDVLVLRGVFGGSMLEVAAGEGRGPVSGPSAGALTLRRLRQTGAAQDLEPLAEAAREAEGDALLLTGGAASERCAVVELAGVEGSRDEGGELVELVVGFRSNGAEAEGYRALAEGCEPLPPSSVRRAGLLEEVRFFLRRNDRQPGAASGHQLSLVRFFPGSERVHPRSPKSGVALVDYALDLQVALGLDLDGDGVIVEGSGAGRSSDEWLYNDAGDSAGPPSWPAGRLGLIRSTLLLRAARASRGHVSPRPDRLEDHGQDSTSDDPESRLYLRGSTTATVRPRSR